VSGFGRHGRLPIVLALGLTYLLAFGINLFVLPHNSILSSLYVLPVLIAAHLLPPLPIAFTGATSVVLYLINARLEERPALVWPAGAATLAAVTYLAVLFSRQRQQTVRHAREVEEAHRRLQQFMGMVGHDLAGALTGVLGFAELRARQGGVRGGAVQTEVELALDGATRRVRRLVDDLRDASRIGTGHFTVQKAPMDLIVTLRQVVAEQRALAPTHCIALDAPAHLWGTWDAERLAQLFANLIANGVAYSPPGTAVRVQVRGAPGEGEAVVSVTDRGVGIAPESREALFQPYFRLGDRATTKGMGLGLYIARAVADAHGSRIWVESAPGAGSTFFVTLPLGVQAPGGRAQGVSTPGRAGGAGRGVEPAGRAGALAS
jgi:signal transduction histidine kinase